MGTRNQIAVASLHAYSNTVLLSILVLQRLHSHTITLLALNKLVQQVLYKYKSFRCTFQYSGLRKLCV